jgi:hypothetical protein
MFTWTSARLGSSYTISAFELGFCLPEEVRAQLIDDPPQDVDAFTDAVITSEGLDPVLLDKGLRQQVRSRVARSFGLP